MVDVMVPRSAAELPAEHALPGGTVYQPKLDGIRCVATIDAEGVTLRSRPRAGKPEGTDITELFPEIAAALREEYAAAALPPGRPLVLDGELVNLHPAALLEGGPPPASGLLFDFGAVMRRFGARPSTIRTLSEGEPCTYVAFDLLEGRQGDLRGMPYSQRRRELEQLPRRSPRLRVIPATRSREQALRWYTDFALAGVEGIVARGDSSLYRPGRAGWVKVRHQGTRDVVVAATLGTLTHPTRLVLGAWDAAGTLVVSGSTANLAEHSASVGALLNLPTNEHPWAASEGMNRLLVEPFVGEVLFHPAAGIQQIWVRARLDRTPEEMRAQALRPTAPTARTPVVQGRPAPRSSGVRRAAP